MGVKAVEAIMIESDETIFAFGDVKTNTSRFIKTELAEMCGPGSGDWSVVTTAIDLPSGTKLNVSLMWASNAAGGLQTPGTYEAKKKQKAEGEAIVRAHEQDFMVVKKTSFKGRLQGARARLRIVHGKDSKIRGVALAGKPAWSEIEKRMRGGAKGKGTRK